MSIATVNDDIYLAHTKNNAIYKISNNNRVFEGNIVVVGNENSYGDNRYAFNGTNALLNKPRNIIKNSQNTELFFIDNNTLIKNVKINAASAQGEDIEKDLLESGIEAGYNVFTDIGYTYAKGAQNTKLYFVDLHKIYFIDFNTQTFKKSTNSLSDNSKFIGISYDNETLYYAYINSDTLYVKKRITLDTLDSLDLYNFDINIDSNINISSSFDIIFGFVYIDNQIIISGSNITTNRYGLELFNRNGDTDNYISSYSNINTELKIKTLTNYNAIFNDDTNELILGRSEDDGEYYIIIIENLMISNQILLKDKFQINNITPEPDIIINNNDIIYTNKEYKDKDISILYKSNSNINILKYNYSSFQTTKLDVDNKSFNYIQDIAIDNNDTLYIAERDSHTIYTIDLSTEPQYEPQSFLENVSNIQTIHYTNNQLHYITNDSYYFIDIDIDIDNKNTDILSNITKTEPLDSLDLVTDLAIDKENNVGYIAFEERLKWFYPKIN